MKQTVLLGGLLALALGSFAAAPAQAHDACDRYGRSDSRGSYSGGYGRGYSGGYYDGGYGGYSGYAYDGGYGYSRGGDAHDYVHERLDARHERAHERGFYSEYDHDRYHARLARKHDVAHHRLYDEHAPNRARWYYGDDRDW